MEVIFLIQRANVLFIFVYLFMCYGSSHDGSVDVLCMFMMYIEPCCFFQGAAFWRFVPKLYNNASVLCFSGGS